MQNYTEISIDQQIKSSLALLLNNDKTALSCSSGTAFPTTNLQIGMLCYRTDLDLLYILKDLTPTWVGLRFPQVEVNDGTAAAPTLTFASDKDTGIYRKSADSIGLSTAGVERAYIDNNGNVKLAGGNLAVGAASISSQAAINVNKTYTPESGTGYGANFLVYASNQTLTNDRSSYGVLSSVQSQVQNDAAFSHTTYGASFTASTSATAGNSIDGEGSLVGLYAVANHQSDDPTYRLMETIYGVYALAQASGDNAYIDHAYAIRSRLQCAVAGATINNAYGLYLSMDTPVGTVTNRYGVYQNGSTSRNIFTGDMQIGGTIPTGQAVGGLGVGTAPTGAGKINASGDVTAPKFIGALQGNADTVTNGVYTTGDQTIDGVKTFSSTIQGNISGSSGSCTGNAATATYCNAASGYWQTAQINSSTANGTDTAALKVNNNGGTGDTGVAAISYNCIGNYAIKLHLRADGYFGLGGWSRAAWSWYSDPSGNMVAAGNVTAYSDPRLKENFQRVVDPFAILNEIVGGTFTWRHGFAHTECKAGKRDYGILADQVETVMPEIVTNSIEIDGESYKTVAYEKLVPVLVEAIKQLQQRVVELERIVKEPKP